MSLDPSTRQHFPNRVALIQRAILPQRFLKFLPRLRILKIQLPQHVVFVLESPSLFDDLPRHLLDLPHKILPFHPTMLDFLQFVLPLTRHFWRLQNLDPQRIQGFEQAKRLRRRHQLAPHPPNILLRNQRFDGGSPRCRGSQPALPHRIPQCVVFDQFSCPFHRTQQSRFRQTCRWLGLQSLCQDCHRLHLLPLHHRNQKFSLLPAPFLHSFFPIDRQPTRLFQNFSICPKSMFSNSSNPVRDLVNRLRIKHRYESPDNCRIYLNLNLIQFFRNLHGRNDRKVVAYLGTVEDPLRRFQPTIPQHCFRKFAVLGSCKVLQRCFCHFQIILRQIPGIGSGIGDRLVLLVQGLCNLQRPPCR